MKIFFLTYGTQEVASSRTRVYQYIPYLEKAGMRYFILPYKCYLAQNRIKFNIWEYVKRKFNGGIKCLKILFFTVYCDVVFIQKVLLPLWFQKLIKILNNNIKFDFDDAIYVSPDVCVSENDIQLRTRLSYIIQIAKSVVLENEYTKEFALQFNKNIMMITGPIDCKRYYPKEKDGGMNIVIGWIGMPPNTSYVTPLFNVFQNINQNYPNVIFELIGASDLSIKGVNIRVKDWSLESEVRCLQNFDIGIMPLPDNEWTKGKGGYKLLQYMAIGIPCIASPVGINSVLIKEGINGYLADSEDQWYEKLEILIKDKRLRESIGVNGRKIAEELYSFEVNAPKLIQFIKN